VITDDSRISLSLVTNAQDTAPRALELGGLGELEALLRDHAEHFAEKNGPALIGATFNGKGRQDTNATAYHVALLDFDGLPDRELAGLLGWLSGFEHVLHTTASHGDPSAGKKWRPGTHNLRVLMPLAAPMTADTAHVLAMRVRALHACLAELMPGRCARAFDRALWRPGALGYTPRRARPGAPAARIEAHAGARLDVTTLDLDRVLRARDRHVDAEDAALGALTGEKLPARVVSALATLPADDYQDWVRFGLALKRSGASDAFDAWAAWSSTAAAPSPLGELARKWNALDCDRRAGSIGLGSIIHEAREAGWHDPQPARVMHDPFAGHVRRPFEDARAELGARMLEDIKRGGRYGYVVTAGVGKTYAATQEALVQGLMGEGGETFRALYVAETHAQIADVRAALDSAITRAGDRGDLLTRERAALARQRVHVAPTRTRSNCARLATYATLRQVDPSGASDYCRHHCPNRNACPFLEDRQRFEHGGVTLMTHESFARRFERRGARAATADLGLHLDANAWTALLDGGDLDDTRIRPTARVTDRRVTLSLEVGGAGATWAPELLEGEDWRRDEQNRARLTDAGREVARRWFAEWGGFEVGTSDEELTAKYERFAELAVDLVIIDEDVTPKLMQPTVITREHLHGLFDAGDLRGERARAELGRLLLESEEGRAKARQLGGLVLDDFEVTGTTAWIGGLADRAFEWVTTGCHDEAPSGLDTAPGLATYDALTHAARSGWYGCEAHKGALHVYGATHLELGFARTVLYLDATGHDHAARAVLGGGCTVRRFYAEHAPGGHVRQVAWGASRSHLEGDHAARRAAVFAERWASGGLLGTHKAHNPDALEDGAELTGAGAAAARIDLTPLHFNGAAARGSNAFEDAPRIALHTYHCAGVAVRQRAAYYVQTSALEWHDAVALARWDLEGAPVYQLAHRVRPALEAREITYAAPFPIPGLEPDEVVELADLDDTIWSTSGHVPHHGHGVALRAFARAVKHRGAWLARPDFGGLDSCAHPHNHSTPSTPLVPLKVSIEELGVCPAHAFEARRQDAFNRALHNGAKDSPARLAELAGLATATVKTSAGGGARVLMFAPGAAPGREQVAKLVRESAPGLDWFEWAGERVSLRADLRADLMPKLYGLHEAGALDWTSRALEAALRAELGTSRAKVRRLLADAGGLEGLKKAFNAYRASLEPRRPRSPRPRIIVQQAPAWRWRPAYDPIPADVLAAQTPTAQRLWGHVREGALRQACG